ncbi:hypothetical protein CAOG_02857 [Capsaspora owczarzaki ATCC 30864]|uniref:Uncharacterized protein n=1 Tax=Capsaspora owczarzaki (strain ATCC 30864) TaxID=595528 RepID=A0A0D2VNA4_CAPO3|nr:hypothetical protein CAOG_02857 [Capsaspora owczarzaki ATCC 30864]KJE91767.1 hypothetical protein CAOG_002857 [Capsaspora owczarzaki ATCC 30864]|eukprot:XP_004363696.1 hypothetical protein CAOG_02857 [Capsaspora owczarzaki ATCC 30864]
MSSGECNLNTTAERLQDGGIPATLAINIPGFVLLFALFCYFNRAPRAAAQTSERAPLLDSQSRSSAATATASTSSSTSTPSGTSAAAATQYSKKRPSAQRLLSYDETGSSTGLLGRSHAADADADAHDRPANAAANAANAGGGNGSAESMLQDSQDDDDDDQPDETVVELVDDRDARFFHGMGYISWIGPLIKRTDAEMSKTAGIDAIHYLVFTRVLLVLTAAMALLSTGVVLPINYLASDSFHGFAATTISNIPSNSNSIWVHVVFTGVYAFGTYYALSRFYAWVQRTHHQWRVERHDTVMISNIPIEVGPEIVRQHFGWAYPEATVRDVRLAYDVREISSVFKRLRHARHALDRAEGLRRRDGGDGPTSRKPMFYGPVVNDIEYYREEIRALEAQVESCKQRLQGASAGIAFVSFEAPEMAATIIAQHRSGWPKHSMHSALLRPTSWFVELAPLPSDIHWPALGISNFAWYIRFLVVNAILLLFLLFFTTPISLLSSLERLSKTEAFSGISASIADSSFLTNYLPTLLLFLFALLLPLIIFWSTELEEHRTRSNMHLSLARKTFAYLVMSILILPGFLLTSADAFIEITLGKNESLVDKFECVFLPDNGALFVNYLLMASLLGIPIAMLNLLPLLVFKYRVWRAVTASELARAQRAKKQTFSYGEEYARLAAIFCIVLVFSTTCPIITVIGVVYFGLKYLSDKYALCFVHNPTFTSDGRLIKTSINFILVCVVIFEIIVLGFFILKTEAASPISRTLLIVLVLTLFLIALKFFKVSCYPLVGFRPPSKQERMARQLRAPEQPNGAQSVSVAGSGVIPPADADEDAPSDVGSESDDDFNADLAFAASDDEEDYVAQKQQRQARQLQRAARRHAKEQQEADMAASAAVTSREHERPYVPPFMLNWSAKGEWSSEPRWENFGAQQRPAQQIRSPPQPVVTTQPASRDLTSPVVIPRDDSHADAHELHPE